MGVSISALPSGSLPQETRITNQPAVGHIAWKRQAGINRYRLQIATDEQFRDVLFDGLIQGTDYIVNDLRPGCYYWRVASAEQQTGQFQKATLFEVRLVGHKLRRLSSTTSTLESPAGGEKGIARLPMPGWSVATGEIVTLMTAQLRRGATLDFLAVNAEGTVYAIEGSTGVALWVAPFKSESIDTQGREYCPPFHPLLIGTPNGGSLVVVAFDGGLRALEGKTGQEIWTTKLPSRPTAGSVIGPGGGDCLIYLNDERAARLYVLSGTTGELRSEVSLPDMAIGPPVLLDIDHSPQLLIPLKGGLVIIQTMGGRYLRSLRVGTDVTTQPVVVETGKGTFVLFGTKKGLRGFEARSLHPLGNFVIDSGDYPIGTLAVADLNGDRIPEVVMTSAGGRVMAINVSSERTMWSVSLGYYGSAPVFADVNADGQLDVILPGKHNFAVGLSGDSGSVIWESSDDSWFAAEGVIGARALAVSSLSDGSLILVGNDRLSAGLRAVEVKRP